MTRRLPQVALLVVAEVVVALDVDLPVVRPLLALAVLLGVPTALLFRRGDFLGDHPPARLLYAFGGSLLGLMLGGLLLNTVLPVLGEYHPLQPAAVAGASLVANLALLCWRASRVSPLALAPVAVVRRLAGARIEVAQGLAVVALVLSVVGAVRLNNDAGGQVAVAALLCVVASLVALMVRPPGTLGRDLRVLGLVALALLLATSLRGWTITGHDIQSEYLTFTLTNDHQRWAMSWWENAYNACLSLNVLPTVLVQATGLPGVVVFKVLLQLVFALVPVLTYLLAGRFLERRMALGAAVVSMSLPTFYTDMPYLVRQEVAFFFLALLLLAASAPAPQRSRLPLVGVLGVGVVVSHYSTTYLLLLCLVLALSALFGWRLLGRIRRRRGRAVSRETGWPRSLVLLNPILVAFLAAASWVWAGPVTDTGGHARTVAADAIRAILGGGDSTPGSSDLSYLLFSGHSATPRERLDQFVDETIEARRLAPRRVLLVKRPGEAELRPPIVKAGATPRTRLGERVEELGLDTDVVITVARVGGAAMVQVLLALGLVWMVRKRRAPDRRTLDPASRVPEEAFFVCVGAGAALAVVVLVPQLSVDYGVLRAFQQTLLAVSPVIAAGIWVLVRPVRSRRVALSIAIPVGLLVAFSGLLTALLGGHSGRLALSNSGLYYERYYAADSDVRAVDWVVHAGEGAPTPPKVIANRNIGVRMLSADPHALVADRLYPTLLTTDEYVFVDARLGETGRSAVFYTGDFITYRYPLDDLDRHLDLVYSSDRTRIYR